MDRSKAFYEELGFVPVMEWAPPEGSPRICHLKLGDTILELFWFSEHQSAPPGSSELWTDLPRIGAKHLALQVESIEEAKQFVESKQWATDIEVVHGKTGVTYFFIVDPSGILLEFVQDDRRL